MSAVAEQKKLIKGGAFLIEERNPEEIFTPEDFTEEHRMIAETTRQFIDNEVTPHIDELEHHDWALARNLVKKAAEVLAYTFHYLHKLPVRVVRFFTVYGPRGRPDMTPYLFVDAMVKHKPITLFNGGAGVYRDWTYVDDIVAGVVAALDTDIPFDTFNLGNSSPVQLSDFIALLEQVTDLEAIIESKPLPAADPPITYANVDKARSLLGFEPHTSLEVGLDRFWAWYQAEVLGK